MSEFWFDPKHRDGWFSATPDFDKKCYALFDREWKRGVNGELAHWQEASGGSLALCVLFDQLPLNMYRGSAKSFSSEHLARDIAHEAIERGYDSSMPSQHRQFFYLPFMHSEDPIDQDFSVALFESAGMQANLKWAEHHRSIIRRFGRFPHRNVILGRESSQEELDWLAFGGFRG